MRGCSERGSLRGSERGGSLRGGSKRGCSVRGGESLRGEVFSIPCCPRMRFSAPSGSVGRTTRTGRSSRPPRGSVSGLVAGEFVFGLFAGELGFSSPVLGDRRFGSPGLNGRPPGSFAAGALAFGFVVVVAAGLAVGLFPTCPGSAFRGSRPRYIRERLKSSSSEVPGVRSAAPVGPSGN